MTKSPSAKRFFVSPPTDSRFDPDWSGPEEDTAAFREISYLDHIEDLDLNILCEPEPPGEEELDDEFEELGTEEVGPDDPNLIFRLYAAEACATPLLTRDKETELAKKMEDLRGSIQETIFRLPIFYEYLKELGIHASPLLCSVSVQDEEETRIRVASMQAQKLLRRIMPKVEKTGILLRRDSRVLAPMPDSERRFLKHVERRFRMCIFELLEDWQSIRDEYAELEQTRNSFILANLRLVINISGSYDGRGLQRDDLIQIGNIGLMKAVERFKYQKGYKFSTYAGWWIRQAMTRALIDQGNVVRIPVHMAEKLSRINRAIESLGEKFREYDFQLLSQMTGYSQEVIRFALSLKRPGSLHDKVRGKDEGDGDEVGDFIEDITSPCPLAETEKSQFSQRLGTLLKTLNEKEEHVIRMRFGIGHSRNFTLEEIGAAMKLTKERIRQIESKALRKLRHPSRASKLSIFRA